MTGDIFWLVRIPSFVLFTSVFIFLFQGGSQFELSDFSTDIPIDNCRMFVFGALCWGQSPYWGHGMWGLRGKSAFLCLRWQGVMWLKWLEDVRSRRYAQAAENCSHAPRADGETEVMTVDVEWNGGSAKFERISPWRRQMEEGRNRARETVLRGKIITTWP